MFPLCGNWFKRFKSSFQSRGRAMTVSWSRQALLKDKMNTGRYGILLYLFGFLYFPIENMTFLNCIHQRKTCLGVGLYLGWNRKMAFHNYSTNWKIKCSKIHLICFPACMQKCRWWIYQTMLHTRWMVTLLWMLTNPSLQVLWVRVAY